MLAIARGPAALGLIIRTPTVTLCPDGPNALQCHSTLGS